MRLVGVAWKIAMMAVLTAAAAFPPFVAWLVTLGSAGASARVGGRCCVWWSRAMLRLLGIRLTVEHAPPPGVHLVAANHMSYLDIWVLGSLQPCAFVAKREISGWPVFGGIATVAGTLFVDRENARSLVNTTRAMEGHLGRGLVMMLFAEGKATCGDAVHPFMPSLFEPAARLSLPCYGASISYRTPGSAEPPSETVCWWRSDPFPPHLLRLLRLPRIEADLRFTREPVVSDNRKKLARELHTAVAESFVPVRQVPLEESA